MTTLPIEIIDIIMGYDGTTKNRNGRYIKQLVVDEAIYENMLRIRVLNDRIIMERENILLVYEGMNNVFIQDEILRLFYEILDVLTLKENTWDYDDFGIVFEIENVFEAFILYDGIVYLNKGMLNSNSI